MIKRQYQKDGLSYLLSASFPFYGIYFKEHSIAHQILDRPVIPSVGEDGEVGLQH